MTSTTNNPWEQLFREMGAAFARQAKEAFIGTVTSVSASGIGLSIDGDSTGTKKYTCARSERFASGDRVLVMRISGTYVAVCKIGSPGGPTAKTAAMTQAVGADANGGLWTAPAPDPYTLPTASPSTLGGVKTSEAYSSTKHTLNVAIDTNGKLYAEKPTAYSLPTASTSALGGVKTSEAYSSTKHKLKVAVNASGALYAEEPGAYSLPTASTSTLGGVKTSEAYSSTKHTLNVAIDSNGKLYAEKPTAYSLPTASTSALGGVKTSETYSSAKHTLKVAADSGGALYAEAPAAYSLPTASTSQIGGIKTSAAYSSATHTVKVAVNASGELFAEKQDAANVSRLYAGTSTSNYIELDSNKALKPSGTGFALGTSTYPFAEVYFGKYGSGSQYLKAEKGSIIPNSTYSVSGYFDLGSATYPFNRLYVKELYINGTKFTPS